MYDAPGASPTDDVLRKIIFHFGQIVSNNPVLRLH
jgi:hypothetical protein